MSKKTGITDRQGKEIIEGDFVSLDGNITADDSLGLLPNGWIFSKNDIYQVYFDPRINEWSLRLGVEPDSALNRKYMNHAVSTLLSGEVDIIKVGMHPKHPHTHAPEDWHENGVEYGAYCLCHKCGMVSHSTTFFDFYADNPGEKLECEICMRKSRLEK